MVGTSANEKACNSRHTPDSSFWKETPHLRAVLKSEACWSYDCKARFLLPTWSGCFLIAIRLFGCRIRPHSANQRPSLSATIEARMMDSSTTVKCVRRDGVQVGERLVPFIVYYSVALPNKLGDRSSNRVWRLNTMPVSNLFQHLHPLVLT